MTPTPPSDRPPDGWLQQYAPALLLTYDFSRFEIVLTVGDHCWEFLRLLTSIYPTILGVILHRHDVLQDAHSPYPGRIFRCLPPLDRSSAVVLAHALSDWDDERARTLLVQVRSILPPGSTLLLAEETPDVNEPRRTANGLRRLLHDTGFRLTTVIPTACPAYWIEGKAEERRDGDQ